MALVSYVVTTPHGANKEGDVIQMDSEQAQPLVDAGYIAEATADDIGTDEPEGDQPLAPDEAMTRSLENAITKATEATVAKLSKAKAHSLPKVHAEIKDKTAGVKDLGELCRLMAFAKRGDYNANRKLNAYNLATKGPTGASESVNADGGYAVVPEWTKEIWDKARDYPSLLERTRKYTIGGQTLNVPSINEVSRADGSRFGGLQSYYIGEGNPFTGSKMGLTQTSLTLKKLGVFCYETNELIADNAFNFTSYLQEKVALELLFKTNDGLVNGGGSTDPLGMLNERSLITVASSSGAHVVSFPDLVNMYTQLYFTSRANAVWLINQEVMPALIAMTFPTVSGTFSAFGGVSFNSHDEWPMRIFGKPVIEVENCAALGNTGDIILCDLSQTAVIEKDMQVALSTDFHFNQDETVYRFIHRWDARSPWTAALAPYKGSKSYSPYVVLAGRGT